MPRHTLAARRRGDPGARGSDLLQLVDLPEPVVGPDVILVRARAPEACEPVDSKIRKGRPATKYPCHYPLVPG
ncbi:MAG: hypothetical protein AVDCRST_MAG76-2334 [uncultured Acidimicrobiales bacterium]|uniref:Uncharacterized protein n=1 Tax=uncultured Acidimicrobiales bacterium TaxID=310071 RepID=A0A6J4IJI1_9ACTN|nr:MAG: hypothetical protein AVDCRST_MAG76-2334 [uncultured Acidimicrobiales bacterium]